jgi:hypothetical protein
MTVIRDRFSFRKWFNQLSSSIIDIKHKVTTNFSIQIVALRSTILDGLEVIY